MKIFKKFKIWWRGKRLPPPIEEIPNLIYNPNYEFPGKYKHPFLAKLLIVIGQFWLRHWKFIITIMVAIIAIIMQRKIK